MTINFGVLIGVFVGLLVGGGGMLAGLVLAGRRIVGEARNQAEQIRQTTRREAETSAKEMALAAQQEQHRAKAAYEREHEAQRRKLEDHENRLNKREDVLDKKLDTLAVKERHLEDLDGKLGRREKAVVAQEAEVAASLQQQRQRLVELSNLSIEQAREMLLKRLEEECRADCGEIVQRVVDQTTEEAKERSRQIVLEAIQRYASQQTSDHTVSTVTIPTDDMKGRVIGREGRNIRAFEKSTGVDVIIDDTPGLVVVSCFDPVRREVARISLERLVQDGRIHPARIEEIVATTSKEMEEQLVRMGKDAAVEANLPNLAKPVQAMLGRLAYRTSYSQNVLRHSLEVAYLSQVIADELGLDGTLARRAGLLHDIGKAMDHEQEGSHPQLGMEFLRRFGEPEAVLNAALAHHGDQPATTPYTLIVMAADAISASRPGARRESLERYVKRLQDLEGLAMTFDGVRQAYAIQAGREVRVIVDAKLLDDRSSAKVAHDIAKKIERELHYPGEIKVTVLREVRAVEYAR
jgi:ribonucrease Y